MSINLPPVLIIEKNKIASVNPWLVLLEIVMPDNTQINLVHNTEDIIFGGKTYTAFPFQLEIPDLNSKGEVPSWTLRVCNISGIIQGYAESLDGLVGSDITIRFVNAGYLLEDYDNLAVTLQIISASATAEWMTWQLGMASPLRRRFPVDRYIADHCRFKFKGHECGYTGNATSCKRNLDACRALGNSARFGGHVGMSNNQVRVN